MSFKLLELSGAKVIIDEHNRCLYFWQSVPPYMSAGKRFGWSGSSAALSVNKAILDLARENSLAIRILIEDKADRTYETTPEEWLDFAGRHGSIELRKGVQIYVMQWDRAHFRTIRGDFSDILRLFGAEVKRKCQKIVL